MKAFLKYLVIQSKMDLRDKGTLMTFYLTPLLFFLIMGSVFSAINPQIRSTLSASMTIFAVTMGAVMGVPLPIVKLRESGTLRAFTVNGIPGTAVLLVQGLSAFLHLLIVSVVIYAVSPLAFHAAVPVSPAGYFSVVLLCLIANIGLGLLIGVAARDQSFATMLSMIVFFPTVMLSGIMFPASMLPKAFQWLGRIFPATYSLQSAYGLAYRKETDINPVLSLGVIAGIALLALAAAFWRMNQIRLTERL